ncbi:SUF system NifU family Fe-S cluster assembly protein [Helcobacillus sp. ACRRO]|uniref:Fe-S cluster assembly sulfur transfer protein SufU n=1 Tax=Helcobacillus TaxID=1161125 RepID=UPI001EF62DC2|nr:SUF system NifU family Fe-S cluster assembly protein [Helcobacillus massiliensis]MCG7426548.1 SUF system NifU family Fe-S cluster assembly protein [Helcobacillus sp. ACRRO]MDK7741199.1 SUF system NifU family Fe-S cluster assembly protein [Helcobacillus massiliensis]WOO94005.1 SUF system NifU family Fe-S cluster assembly protein [Helcobacillus massiliensis]
MTSPLTALYSELIFDHDKHPQNAGLRDPFDAEVHHVNPTCGDEITLRIRLSEDGRRVEDLPYEAQGCAMSRASASIMTDLFIGRTREEIEEISAHMDEAMHSRGRIAGDEDVLGDGVALTGASKFPGRVKCVLMAWKAYQAALADALTARKDTENDH